MPRKSQGGIRMAKVKLKSNPVIKRTVEDENLYLVTWGAYKNKKFKATYYKKEKGKYKKTTSKKLTVSKYFSHYIVQLQYLQDWGSVGKGTSKTKGDTWLTFETRSTRSKSLTFSPPSGAYKVRVRVKPMSKKSRVVNSGGNKVDYWFTGVYSKWATIVSGEYYEPDKPNAPNITLPSDGNLDKMLISASNLPETQAYTINQGQLEIYESNVSGGSGTSSKQYVKIAARSFSTTKAIKQGKVYKVRLRVSGKAFKKEFWSEWSDWSSELVARPEAPKNIKMEVKSRSSIMFMWDRISSATGYRIKYAYTEDELNIESGPSYHSIDINVSSGGTESQFRYLLSDLEFGQKYYLKIHALSQSGLESPASGVIKFTLGEKPEAPTTWSLVNRAAIGDKVNLYWVHNSEDGSGQVRANIQIMVGSDVVLDTYKDNPIDKWGDYSTETSVYELVTNNYDGQGASFNDSDELLWRVRTCGVTGEYGDWSTQRSLKVYQRPELTVYISAEESGEIVDEVTQYPFYINASSLPITQRPIGYSVTIISNEDYEGYEDTGEMVPILQGSSVYQSFFDVSGEVLDLALTPGDVNLQNGVSYTVKVTASLDSGLTAEDETDFIMALEGSVENWDIRADITYEDDIASATIACCCLYFEDEEDEPDPTVYDLATALDILDHFDTITDQELDYIIGYANYLSDKMSLEEETLTDGEMEFMTAYNELDITIPDDSGEDEDIGDSDTLIGDDDSIVDDVVLSVYRRDHYGKFILIEENLENDLLTTVVDPHPTLDVMRYRIVATSQTTGFMYYEDFFDEEIDESSIIIQWDEAWEDFNYEDTVYADEVRYSGSLLKLPYNIDVSESNQLDTTLVNYIGRERPVSYYGTQLGESPSWSCEIPKEDTETLYQLRRLSTWQGDVYVREPNGSGFWANIQVSMNIKHKSTTIPVTLKINPVEGGI